MESETVEVVTLDFRGLSGRNLHHGILMGSALLDEQPIGQVETTGGMRKITAEPGALFGDRKLVIENGFVQCPVFLTRRGKWATSSIVGLYI